VSNFKNSQGKDAALWRVVYEEVAVGEEDLEETELKQAMYAAEMAEACGGGSPPGCATGKSACKSGGAGGCASSKSGDVVKKRSEAEVAAGTFEKTTVERELYRCYFQSWHPNCVGSDEPAAWIELFEDTTKVMISEDVGIDFSPFIDPEGKHFKMAAPVESSIRDYEGCGVMKLPGGACMQWQFDQLVQYSCGDVKVCFIVVKIPGTPPPTVWHPERKAKPEVQTSADVEKLVRAKFFLGPDSVLRMPGNPWVPWTPCWFNTSIVVNERDKWQRAFVAMEGKHNTLFNKYKELAGQHTKLHEEHGAEVEENTALIKETRLKSTALYNIKESMMCSICLDTGYDVEPAVVSSCGHVLHEKCYWKQKPSMGDTCCKCMKMKQTWFPFTGYTGISAALKQLQTARDAEGEGGAGGGA
jgi:hypothetical protein